MLASLLISSLLVFSPLFAPPLMAQQAPPSEIDNTRSPVYLDDQLLFHVADFKAYAAASRASRISGVLKNVAEDSSIAPDALTFTEDPVSTDIAVGDKILFSLTDADASAEGISRAEMGRLLQRRIGSAIEKYRKDRAPRNLLLAILYSLLTTLVVVVLIWLFIKGDRKARDWFRARVRPVEIRSQEIVRTEWILSAAFGIWRPIRFLIAFGLVMGYLDFLLSLFPWTRAFSFQMRDYIVAPLKILAAGIRQQIPNLFFVAVVVVVTYYLLKLVRFAFFEIEQGRVTLPGFDPDWSQPTYNIARVLVIAFALVVAFPYIPGSDSIAFKGVSVFIGVLFSLGSTSAISNMVAGVLLTYTRAFKVGDVVTIGESTGTVTEVNMLVTNIRTVKLVDITIPNSMILNTHVFNFSKAVRSKEALILHTSVTIGYDTPWRQVEALLLMAAGRTPGLLPEPAPFVLQTELEDFYIRYQLNVATAEPRKMLLTYSKLHANIQDAFNEYSVQIMSPNYIADRSVPTFVPRKKWYSAPAKAPESEISSEISKEK